jgi:Na+/proline symporter
MTPLDYAVVLLYIVLTVWLGVAHARRSSTNLRSYFLGGNEIPWWALAASGAASNFDIAGTMWMVSMVAALGMRSFWVFCTFAIFNCAFLMAYMAPWIRRTKVLTATELIHSRFGTQSGGRVARLASAIMVTLFQGFALGLAFVGIGKFAAEYIPLSAHACAILIMTVTTMYAMIGGFKGVIVTDVFQAVLMSLCGLLVGGATFFIIDPDRLHALGFVTSLIPVGKLEGLPPSLVASGYDLFGIMAVLWMLNGLFHSTGGAGGSYGEQRFLATRSAADAAKVGFAWGIMMIPRFCLVAGIVFIVMCGSMGVTDPEKILPVALRDSTLIPSGVRGFMMAALLAAFMGSLSSTLNAGASIIVRDIVEVLKPGLSQKALVRAGHLATVGLLLFGTAAGMNADSINSIWLWMQLGLAASMLLPNVLRWHWWRMNGWGYSAGTLLACVLSLAVFFWKHVPMLVAIHPEPVPYIYTPFVYAVSLIGAITVSLATQPVDPATLDEFYRRVRPRGFWGTVKNRVGPLPPLSGADASATRILVNVLLGGALIMCTYFGVFYLIGHWFAYAGICAGIACVSGAALYFTWYIPLRNEELENAKDPSE